MSSTAELSEEIALVLAAAYEAYDLKGVAASLGLPVADDDPITSKQIYVRSKILHWPLSDLIALAERVLRLVDDPALRERLDLIREASAPGISEITRAAILDFLAGQGSIAGKRDILEFAQSIWPIGSTTNESSFFGWQQRSLADQIWQHMVRNNDWSYADFFEAVGARTCSQRRFFLLLEQDVHPLTRNAEEQAIYVRGLSSLLSPDGFELRVAEVRSGHPIFRVTGRGAGVSVAVKNLIFAAEGPKPDLVLADAVSNDVQIVRNAEYCLVFTDSIPARVSLGPRSSRGGRSRREWKPTHEKQR